ncbi:MAG: endonuclease III [Planctomycetota bacterium]|nr:endonuclease III [Planctomycetota bacterium]
MLADKKISKVLDTLGERYPDLKFAEFNRRDPFRTLVSCVISQRTRDEQTFEVARRLFRRARTPRGIAALGTRELESILRRSGFYRQKARHIREISRLIAARHGGVTPNTMEELLTLPGVGRKTANIVLSFGFGIPAIAVDTHVHRISNRLGMVRTKNPEETERALERRIERSKWISVNNLLVRHGQETCKPIRPLCGACGLAGICETGRARG